MGNTPRSVPENMAYRTGYHSQYVRLGGDRRRLTSFDPFNTSLSADGSDGREAGIARWLTADIPGELLDASSISRPCSPRSSSYVTRCGCPSGT